MRKLSFRKASSGAGWGTEALVIWPPLGPGHQHGCAHNTGRPSRASHFRDEEADVQGISTQPKAPSQGGATGPGPTGRGPKPACFSEHCSPSGGMDKIYTQAASPGPLAMWTQSQASDSSTTHKATHLQEGAEGFCPQRACSRPYPGLSELLPPSHCMLVNAHHIRANRCPWNHAPHALWL